MGRVSGGAGAGPKRPIDAGAPRPPASSYFIYHNEVRAAVQAQRPHMGHRDVSQLIVTMWRDMPMHKKQKYISLMNDRRRKYLEEVHAYRQTDAYREHQKKLKLFHRERRKVAKDDDDSDNGDKTTSLVEGTEIPIFSEAFLRHNKERERLLRTTRTQLSAVESQRSALAGRQAALREATDALANDAHRLHARTGRTRHKTNVLTAALLNAVDGLKLPGSSQETPTAANLSKWLQAAARAAAHNAAFDKALRAAIGQVNIGS